jgi:hypothetical protein
MIMVTLRQSTKVPERRFYMSAYGHKTEMLAVTGKSTKETVKTIVQGMPVVAVYPWLLTRVLFVAHTASGATRIRHSPRPLHSGGS